MSRRAEEFSAHIRMRADDLVREGLSPAEATRQAHREFGHIETHRERARTARGLRWIDELHFSWIDLRLAVRMMFKYPGLTLVAGFALALGIPTGLAPMHPARALDRPRPEDTDDRVRAIRFWDPMTGVPRQRRAHRFRREQETMDRRTCRLAGSADWPCRWQQA